jgi:hypothetical protein
MMRRRMTAIAVLMLALVPATWNACSQSGGQSSSANSAQGASPGFKAFQSGFYAYATAPNSCVVCHTTTAPKFASPDVNAAYAAAKGQQTSSSLPLIDFTNPSASIIATRAGDGHCGMALCSGSAASANVKPLLATWATAEITGAGPGATPTPTPVPTQFLTATMPLPSPIPALGATPAVMRFDLSRLGVAVAGLNGAIFELQIGMANATEYRISNPRIVGNSKPLTLHGIHIYLRPASGSGVGTEDLSQGSLWSNVSASVAVSTLPSPLPTGPFTTPVLSTTVLDIQTQSSADDMTIAFDSF